MWTEYPKYLSLSLPHGAAFIEYDGGVWRWRVDKPDDREWTDEIYNLPELEGWWGIADSKEAAQKAAEQALNV